MFINHHKPTIAFYSPETYQTLILKDSFPYSDIPQSITLLVQETYISDLKPEDEENIWIGLSFLKQEGEEISIFDLDFKRMRAFWKKVEFKVGEGMVEGDEVLVGKGLKREDIEEFVKIFNKG